MKIGILGGSFDPIHYGHLCMAENAYKEYRLDQVWLMPAGHSPNKKESEMTSKEQRVDMARLAASEYPFLYVSTLETDSSERSYTYRTMEKLHESYPKDTFYFIMGADSLDYLDKWVHPEIICRLSIVLVMSRDERKEQELSDKIREIKALFPADIRIIHCGRYHISSSEIRKKLEKGEGVQKHLPQKVWNYIMEQGLYQPKVSL